MPEWNNVAILGVGLIGGSIGLALRQRALCHQIVGIGRQRGRLQLAKKRGAVTEITTSIERGVSHADLVVVCTPVQFVAAHVLEVAEACRPGTLITDAGSTKESMVQDIESRLPKGVAFVGSHPLAGSDKSGVAFAEADLFVDRVAVVTPTRRSAAISVRAISEFWSSLGATTIQMSPKAHDKAVAATSHLPHVVASALSAGTPQRYLPLVAGGWLDATRIAGADVELWTQILLENRANVSIALGDIRSRLEAFERALKEDDAHNLARLLAAGKQRRDAVGN